jgi:NAD(P)-dependent dehydrogenase (short-subunit alcohol dehydrogenase family)
VEHERYHHARVDLADVVALERWCATDLAPRLAAAAPALFALVNNAATLEPVGPLERLAPAALARALTVNVAAPLALSGFALRALPDVPLRIVDLSSGAAHAPYPGWASYCTTKAALLMASRCVAEDARAFAQHAGRDVRVVSYAPHVVATAMQAAIRATDVADFPGRARFVELHETGALVDARGPAEELAELLLDPELPAFSERRFTPR